jgi:hypothetical protein
MGKLYIFSLNAEKNFLQMFLDYVIMIKYQQMPHADRYRNVCKSGNFQQSALHEAVSCR